MRTRGLMSSGLSLFTSQMITGGGDVRIGESE